MIEIPKQSSNEDGREAATLPKTEFSQEIRFAVVMYGGSSLAIYMYGVAQELLRLVRATAAKPMKPDDVLREGRGDLHREKATGSERVYRELGQMLVRGHSPRLDVKPADSVRTRFVIDVVSGTSAGGINGVFLAKALANDQELSQLRKLWVDTADFGNLLNDAQGLAAPQKPPKSLVNSPLMYSKLYDALAKMESDKPRDSKWQSPYVEELDLYTTFTDVYGQVISLQLADVVASERKHLHNFRFSYKSDGDGEKPENDFLGINDPFLAFAARSTSAHQAAFEPMILDDIRLANCAPGTKAWRKFYEDYLQPDKVRDFKRRPGTRSALPQDPNPSTDKLAEEFQKRPLVDGGTLDNSPFTFAIDQLRSRHVHLPVDRKLLYVEPAPEHPENEVQGPMAKPDMVTNAIMGLATIPSYQFIRDDIQRILDRNLLIGRVNRILQGAEEDYSYEKARVPEGEKLAEPAGPAWASYQRLRIGETTDELNLIVTSAAGFSANSDESLAMWYLLRVWRENAFALSWAQAPRSGPSIRTREAFRESKQEKPEQTAQFGMSEPEFLRNFDIGYQIRRIRFVLHKAGEIACFDDRSTRLVKHAVDDETSEQWAQAQTVSDFRKRARQGLFVAVVGFNRELKALYAMRERLASPARTYAEADHPDGKTQPHPLAEAIAKFGISRDELHRVLEPRTEKKRLKNAAELIGLEVGTTEDSANSQGAVKGQRRNALAELLDVVIRKFRVIQESSDNVDKILSSGDAAEETAIATLRFYYEYFDRYDMISYPILYSTGTGEELDPVEVFRISPEDVQYPGGLDPKRLAGLSLGHFGALMDERYRVNDILWGRLDCAERLITLLLKSAAPPANEEEEARLTAKREELIREAQQAIVMEEVSELSHALKTKLGFSKEEPDPVESELRARARSELKTASLSGPSRDYIENQLRESDPLDKFIQNYEELKSLDARKLVETLGRASRILGKMLDDIADQHRVKNPILMWVTRLMRVFWGLVEVALPDSAPNIIARHFLNLLYFVEIILIVAGFLFTSPPVREVGIAGFLITLFVNIVVLIVQDFAKERDLKDVKGYQNHWARFAKTVGIVVAVIVALLAVAALVDVVLGFGYGPILVAYLRTLLVVGL